MLYPVPIPMDILSSANNVFCFAIHDWTAAACDLKDRDPNAFLGHHSDLCGLHQALTGVGNVWPLERKVTLQNRSRSKRALHSQPSPIQLLASESDVV